MWGLMHMQTLEQADIAYALNSIRSTGGSVQDAEVIKFALGSDAKPYLHDIRCGMANASTADKLEALWLH